MTEPINLNDEMQKAGEESLEEIRNYNHERLFTRLFNKLDKLENWKDLRVQEDIRQAAKMEKIIETMHEYDKRNIKFEGQIDSLATKEEVMSIQFSIQEVAHKIDGLEIERQERRQDRREMDLEVKKTFLGLSVDSLREVLKYAAIGYVMYRMGGAG